MGELSLGKTKRAEPEGKTQPVKSYSKNWYKSHCRKCPYLIKDEIMDMLHCIRPAGEGCLAKSLLVSGVILVEVHNEKIKRMYAEQDARKALPPIPHKKIKRRR